MPIILRAALAAALFCLCAAPAAAQTARACQNGVADRAGAERRCMNFNGVERNYYVLGDQSRAGPQRAMIYLHGGGGTAEPYVVQEFLDFHIERGWVALVPNGHNRTWDSTYRPDLLRGAAVSRADDIGFLNAMIDAEAARGLVDRDAVVMNGFSRGALMASRFACDSGASLAGVAIAAGLHHWENECPGPRPMAAWFFHGTEDPFMPYAGGTNTVSGVEVGLRSVDHIVGFWAIVNGCTAFDTETLDNVPGDGTRVEIRTTTRCARAPMQQIIVHGGGHTWANPEGGGEATWLVGRTSQEIDASAVMFDFFEQHVR